MNRRIDLPSALVLLGALLLLASLFVSWFAESNAFEAFEALDLALLALAAAAVLAALGRLARDPDDARPALGIGIAVLVIVLVQLLEPPPGFGDDETEAGVWMALVSGVLMTAGAALALASIHVVVDVQPRDRRPRVAAVDARERPTTPSRDGSGARGGHDPSLDEVERPPSPDEVDDDRTQPMRAMPPDAPS